jgi:phospholipid/cholesterol/gamma-HCH transport system permease protein
MSEPVADKPNRIVEAISNLGGAAIDMLQYIGGIAYLAVDLFKWLVAALIRRTVRVGREAIYLQVVRVGLRSVIIICLVSACIGLILALQMAPPLQEFGQVDKVANIIGVAVLRELGPLISAVVLTGFAGASMAAEIGTMVVGEEIEALESMALNPVRFLVVPRVLATVVSLIVLCVFGDLVSILAGAVMGVAALDIPLSVYQTNTLEQVKLADFVTGLIKAGVFGSLIGLIACYNGLRVTGGAAGVGKATTVTVVHAIVSIILADLVFTALFYALGWA